MHEFSDRAQRAVNVKTTWVNVAFVKGAPRPANAGRKPGSVNKTTASTKAALIAAFEKVGGVPKLVAWGKENPTEFYRLWGRMIPQDVDITSAGEQLAQAIVVLPPEQG